MRLTRTLAAGTTVLALSLLAGCSDDADTEADEPNPTVEARTACEADVALTGKVEQSWTGEGFVITENRSGPVIYRAADGKATLTVFAAEGEFPAVGSLTVGKKTYTTQGDTVEADAEGAGADVDAEARADKPSDVVEIVASIDC